ncbi:MAG: M48 family metallopeptidase [Acidobacteriota bacterium]
MTAVAAHETLPNQQPVCTITPDLGRTVGGLGPAGGRSMRYARVFTLVLVAAFGRSAFADQMADPPARPADVDVDETQPVGVPPPSEKAVEFYESGNVLWVVNQVWMILLPVVILATGLSARLREWAWRVGRRWFFALAAYFILFTILTTIVDLPRAYYEEFMRPHAYGLSNQTQQKWWTDTLITFALTCVIGPLIIWVPYLLLRKSPKRWWLYTTLALLPFIVVANLVAPVWISPLFNTFEPMQDEALEARILDLADRAGIEGSRVFQVNKSVDTKTINAYVAGVFNTERIVLWDTIIARMTDGELLFVMGHEMGHYVLGHIWQLLALSTVVLLGSFYAAYRTAGAVMARYGRRFGFTTLDDFASLPLLLVLTGLFSLLVAPGLLAFNRYLEREADRFGLEITQTSHSAGTAFVKLQTDVLAVPRPGLLNVLWRQSHPPLGERIDFANEYHPWRDGQALVYGRRFTR